MFVGSSFMFAFTHLLLIVLLSSCINNLEVDSSANKPLLDKLETLSISEAESVFSLDINDKNSNLDVDKVGNKITYMCLYDILIDGRVTSPKKCTTIPGFSFNSSSGLIKIVISRELYDEADSNGRYELKIIASSNAGESESIFVLEILSELEPFYIGGKSYERTFPGSMALDSQGKLYVGNFWSKSIQIYDEDLNYLGEILERSNENVGYHGVAIFDDVIYVSEPNSDKVLKVSLTGEILGSFGSNGSGDGQFSRAVGIAVDASRIYVVDSDNDNVQVFDHSFNFLFKFGSTGTGNSQFQSPYGIAVDGSGNIFVSDSNRHRVQKFDSTGAYVLQFGTTGSGTTNFNKPLGIQIYNSELWIADRQNGRVKIHDLSGNYSREFQVTSSGIWSSITPMLYSLAVNNSQVIVGAFYTPGSLMVFDHSGNYLNKQIVHQDEIHFIEGVTVDSSGRIYVADYGNGRVHVYSKERDLLFSVGSTTNTNYVN
jgi:DNA-binding beta-propeller fold protein YncE